MKPNPPIPVDIPNDLNSVILQGIDAGKKAVEHRRRVKRAVSRSICSFAVVIGLFAGGVNLSPAFAAAVEHVPVLGRLVQIFEINQSVAQGGTAANGGIVTVTMDRDGEVEQMRLDFGQADASLYKAEFASYPKTVTITLPGTAGVEVLSQITRAQDTSQYIKSVYEVPAGPAESTVLQLELESDADVQIEEYSHPGSLVIRLTPAEIQLDTIYSVRTLSYTSQELQTVLNQYSGQDTRILQDDSGMFFAELGQYATRDEAQSAAGDLLVEERTGNNVPVCFAAMEQYESSQFLAEYDRLLTSSFTAEPVLDFLEQHLAGAAPEEQEVLLNGLHGFIQNTDEDLDWNQIASFYQTANRGVPGYVQEHLNK